MLITHYLDQPCPKCGVTGKYGNVTVHRDVLKRGCNHCREWTSFYLPEVHKKIIYLDQFFLSHAFRAKEQPFVDAAHRIADMAARQLIVCPYSSVHTKETHLWRDEQQHDLFQFIKQTARGQKFNEDFEIKRIQLNRAFAAFRSASNIIQPIEKSDALREEIDTWDDYFWIDMRPILGDIEALRQGKAAAVAALVDLFPHWAAMTTTFEEDMTIEANGYGQSLMNQYLQRFAALGAGDLTAYLDAPMDAMYVEYLLHFDKNTMPINEQLARAAAFLNSDYFRMIPHLRVSCGLFAMLRKRVKEGSYTNVNKARKTLKGMFYDSNCISIFGPYCDAIFIDRAMHQWCEAPQARVLDPYGTRIFSVADWNAFHMYLDRIEENYTDDIRRAVELVYPELYP